MGLARITDLPTVVTVPLTGAEIFELVQGGTSYQGTMSQIATSLLTGLADGTAAVPSLAFLADTDTGIYRVGTNSLGVSASGSNRLTISNLGATFVDPLTSFSFIPSGSAVPTNGLYLPAANTIGFASNTTLRYSVNSTGQHTIASASSGVSLTVNIGAGGQAQHWADGTITNRLQFATGTAVEFGAFSNHGLNLITNSITRATIAAAGNVTINAPSSGANLTTNALVANYGLIINAAAASWSGLQLQQNGTQRWSFLTDNFAAGAFSLYNNARAAESLTLTSAGNFTIAAPSSGVTLALTSISGQYFLTNTDGTCSFNAYNNGAGGTHLGTTTNHPFAIFTNGFANERVVVAAAGNVTIAAPSSGLGLAVTGLSAITTAAITAISTEVVVGGGQFVAESRFGGYGAGMFMASRTSSGGTLVSMAKIVADGTASWDTTASNQMARLSFWTANTGTLVDRGGISSTGSWTINAPSSGDPLTLNGTAATTVRHIRMQGTTTAPGYIELNNTGGNAWFALESSGGGTLITGAAAYSTVFGTTNATELNLIANSAIRLKISSAGNVTIGGGVAITAGGIATTGVMFTSTATFGVFTGSGAPSMSAAKGSLYLRSDGTGTTDRAYINTNGTTTWTALTTVA